MIRKILIFSEIYYPYSKGGAEKSTQFIAENLAAKGVEVHVCTSADKESEESINGVFVHRIKQHNVYWTYKKEKQNPFKKAIWHSIEVYNIFNCHSILKLVRVVKPDIIHTNVFTGFSVVVWDIAKREKIPIVHTIRDFYLMCLRSTMYNNNMSCGNQCLKCNLVSITKKIKSKKVDAVIGISKFILNKHVENGYFKNARVKDVIPNSVNFYNFGNETRKPIIGFLGRIHVSKGIEMLIDSFLKVDIKDYVLNIAGDGDTDYVEQLKKRYESNKIVFLGRVNAKDFLSKIRLLVVPSKWEEPFGRVIIEANACGCPVFVSNRGGMPELISDSNGKVFDIDDKDSLCRMLQGFINGRMKFNINTDYIVDNYSSDAVVDKYLTIYENINTCTKSGN